MAVIEAYKLERYAEAVFALWQAALGEAWPISLDRFLCVTHSSSYWENYHFVAREGQGIVGFVATQVEHNDDQALKANISALVVAPTWQRRGVGTALHQTALDRLREAGVNKVQLGGGLYRFWPGVPTNLHSAMPFFEAQGWAFSDLSFDLTQNLREYHTPAGIYPPLLDQGISLRVATKEDVPQLLAFVEREFPSWLTAYQDIITIGDYQDILTASDAEDNIVGLLIMYSPQSHQARVDVVWHKLLGDDVGALGTVGVAAAERGKGIGLALVARGSEILNERGVKQCHISWVVLLDFYGKLRYTTWRSYKMSWRKLE